MSTQMGFMSTQMEFQGLGTNLLFLGHLSLLVAASTHSINPMLGIELSQTNGPALHQIMWVTIFWGKHYFFIIYTVPDNNFLGTNTAGAIQVVELS